MVVRSERAASVCWRHARILAWRCCLQMSGGIEGLILVRLGAQVLSGEGLAGRNWEGKSSGEQISQQIIGCFVAQWLQQLVGSGGVLGEKTKSGKV